MSLNIVCTSKPVDGLLYYSYEYCSYLNKSGIDAKLIIICNKSFNRDDYINAITHKYIHCDNIVFDTFSPAVEDVTLIMGRSMMTLSWIAFVGYTHDQQDSLKKLFSGNIISVYSSNHPVDYPNAVNFYSPNYIVDICDTEVYPDAPGKHFEKRINFDIYRPYVDNIQFKYLFLGTNNKYYASAEKAIEMYPDYGILTYNSKYINIDYNNIFAPVENLMGLFDTYVYTKETFDPAPRIFQECKYFGKNVIYHRDKSIVDGGSVYWTRPYRDVDITAIVSAYTQILTLTAFNN